MLGSFNCFQWEFIISIRQYSIVSLMQPVKTEMLEPSCLAATSSFGTPDQLAHDWLLMNDLPESLACCSPTPAQVLRTEADMHSKTSWSQNLLNLAANYQPEVAGTLRTCLRWRPWVLFLMPQVWQRHDICFHWLHMTLDTVSFLVKQFILEPGTRMNWVIFGGKHLSDLKNTFLKDN